MIRSAVLSDKDRVIELLADSRIGAGFDSASGATGFVFPFDRASAERLFLVHLQTPRMLCSVYQTAGRAQGVLMAIAYQHPFGPVWIAKETLWWIDPAHRGGTAANRMLDAYEKWTAVQGCKFAGMAGMGEDPAIGELYKRRGYRVAETHYLKAV